MAANSQDLQQLAAVLEELVIPDKLDGASFFYGSECNDIRDTINLLVRAVKSIQAGTSAPVTAVNPTHRTGTIKPPNTLGVDADTYLNTVNGYFYQKKAGAWVFIMVTKGERGQSAYELWLSKGNQGSEANFLASFEGEAGDDGARGDQWYKVTTKPADALGQDDDFAFEAITSKTYRIWHKENGTWQLIIDLSVEPTPPSGGGTTTYSGSYTTTAADYTAKCGNGTGASVTRSATSTVSEAAAIATAKALAIEAITCTLAPGNTTPAAPVVVYNSELRTLSATHSLGGQLLYSYQGSTFVPYTGTLLIDNLAHAPQEWRFKRAPETGYNESPLAYSPAIAAGSPNGPAAYTVSSEGDSLSANQYRNGFENPWPLQAEMLAADSSILSWNYFAYGGDQFGEGGDTTYMSAPAQKNEVLAAYNATAVRNLLYLLAGINDMQYGASAASTYSRLKALIAFYVAQGYTVVVMTTTTSRHPNSPEHTEFWSRVRAYNNLIRSGFNDGTLGATVLCDTQTDPVLKGYDAPLNPTWFRDLIHYTEAGAGRVAAFAVRALAYAKSGTRKVINYATDTNTANLEPVPVVSYSFSDTFERANGAPGNNWTDVTGKFTIRDGKLVATSDPGVPAALLRPQLEGGTSQRVTSVVPWVLGETYALQARADGNGNGYLAYFTCNATTADVNIFRLDKQPDGTTTASAIDLKGGLPGVTAGTPRTITFVASANIMTATILGGQQVIGASGADDTYTTGVCGIGGGTAGAEYDSITIEQA